MAEPWYQRWLSLGDPLLDWVLAAPRDVALVIVAIFSAGSLLALRGILTDQWKLQAIRDDLRMLARRLRDTQLNEECKRRARRLRTQLALARLRSEIPVIVLSLVPLLLVIDWGSRHLTHAPPEVGNSYRVTFIMSAGSAGSVVHLVPSSQIRARDGWLRKMSLVQHEGRPRSKAEWNVLFRNGGRVNLQFRAGHSTHEFRVLVGESQYVPTRQNLGRNVEAQLHLTHYRPFGIWPDWSLFGLGPWFTAYAVLALAAFALLRRVLRVA